MKGRVTEERIARIVAEWAPLLGLDRMTIDIILREHAVNAEEDDFKNEATTDALTEYGEATLNFNAFNLTIEGLERTVLHEMVHVKNRPIEIAIRTAFKEQLEYASYLIEHHTTQETDSLLAARGRAVKSRSVPCRRRHAA